MAQYRPEQSARARTSSLVLGGALSLAACIADDSMDARLVAAPLERQATYGEETSRSREPPRTTLRVLAEGLSAPWEITWGPDARLWITERSGKRVLRLDPTSGASSTALTLSDVLQSSTQDGLLGMALHSQLLAGTGADFVYLAYSYDADPGAPVERRIKLVRFTFDASRSALVSPTVLLAGLPASNDHNAGRLVFGPDHKLYYAIGDQGSNQFDNFCRPIRAQDLPSQREVDRQDWSAYQGKILRLELDGSIPDDNPVLEGVRSHVYSYGHRNPQGLVFGPRGALYAGEHGPRTDDEINLVRAGGNYGWPHVAGFRDDKAYTYANWSKSQSPPCASLKYDEATIPGSVPQQRESAWSHPDFVAPLRTFYTVESGYPFRDPRCARAEFLCWPTLAPSSIDVYQASPGGVAGEETSLLLTSLKFGTVYRAPLRADGSAVGEAVPLVRTSDRYRDLALSPDGRTLYVVTDAEGETSGPTQGAPQALEHRGAVLAFRLEEQRGE